MATKKTAATTKEVKEKTEKKSQPAMTEKEKLIAELNAKMQKKHGNAFMSANDAKVDYYSTSSLALDSVLGNQNSLGGFPKGRIIEIFGKEGSGKTTISLLAAAEEIRNGGFVLFIDAENAIDPYRVATLGIPVNDPTKFQIIQPDNGEEVFEVAEEYITSGLASMIIIDSVTAIVPKVILEGGYDSSNMGIQARFMSQALRKLTSVANKTKTSIIFINQTRMNIG
jgi:recA bacterial DNA recombination protein